MIAAAAVLAVLSAATGARAQTTPAPGTRPTPANQPVRRGKVYKQPLVNLEEQAAGRRPGQVMPGDPPPEQFAPPGEGARGNPRAPDRPETAPPLPSEPPPIARPTQTPRDNRDPVSGRAIKPAPAPLDPASGPRPLPAPVRPQAGRGEATPPAPAERPVPPPVAPPPPVREERGPRDNGRADIPARETAPGPSEPARRISAGPQAAGEARVRVVGGNAGAQWRPIDGAWERLGDGAGAARTGRFEVRTGLDGEAVIELDGRIELRVLPLSRVRIETRSAENMQPMLTLDRGGIELRPAAVDPVQCWVRTPDRSAGFAVEPGSRVTYSAFDGTAALPLGNRPGG